MWWEEETVYCHKRLQTTLLASLLFAAANTLIMVTTTTSRNDEKEMYYEHQSDDALASTEISTSAASSNNGSDEQLDNPPQQQQRSPRDQVYTNERQGMDVHEEFMKSFRPWHLLDIQNPWVLVPNGSFGSYFDRVPMALRVGPWSVVACCYFAALWYAAILCGCYYFGTSLQQQQDWTLESSSDYPAAYSLQWWYHAGGCVWMIIISGTILVQSPLGYRAWSTFTVLSWTMLTIRHGLCAALPWYPQKAALLQAVEWMRFPCALSHTVVFCVWNFVLVPFLMQFVMKDDEEKRQNFIKFCTSFRLVNLHVVNMFLCVMNVYWASPPRRLVYVDLYVASVWVLLYMTFYLCALDRLGVHLYPVFSPRNGKMVMASWTGTIVLFLVTFVGWRKLLQPSEYHSSITI